MDIKGFLKEVTELPGLSGHERQAAERVADAFTPFADDVRIDRMNNVVARHGQGGPRVLITAHLDEIGLVVSGIEKDGCLRMAMSGGVDPRILPAAEVLVQAKDGALYGVIGAKPPHLLSAEDRKKAIQLKDLYIDMGMSPERVRELIRVGDQVALTGALTELSDGRLASKTMDDRAGVAAMLCCAEQLGRMRARAEALFVSASQEETHSVGATVSGYSLDPDVAIVIDVTHGAGPGTDKWEAFPLDKIVLGQGPSLHPELLRRVQKTAEKHHIECLVEITTGETWTDADPLHVTRAGVPTVLVQIPLRYMHTTVETLNEAVIEETGRLIALFIDDISRDWEDITWF